MRMIPITLKENRSKNFSFLQNNDFSFKVKEYYKNVKSFKSHC
jgi:hypothetical protein